MLEKRLIIKQDQSELTVVQWRITDDDHVVLQPLPEAMVDVELAGQEGVGQHRQVHHWRLWSGGGELWEARWRRAGWQEI